jgi:predicted nucleotidyltransferase
MRVNSNDIKAIRQVTSAIFGETATIRLFGSRTDDTKKGGDIDLLIQFQGNQMISRMEIYQLKIKFLVQLKKIIGDQKIDVIIDNGHQHNTFIHQVYNEGIVL